jgi:hypothetical protein
MALDKKMKPFLIMQGAFMTTSLIGIWNNFFKKLEKLIKRTLYQGIKKLIFLPC